ncbi:MAG: hypothetical protein R6U29_06345 [Desulfosudaceae bacterium]
MIFTPRQLTDLATPYPDRIIEQIRGGHIDTAASLTREMACSRVRLHDFFADSCTVLWSFAGERFGEPALDDMFRFIFEKAAQRQFFEAAGAQTLPHLSVYMLARSWRAHSCFGAGQYPGAFSITEDDEKFTFHLRPCGSGLRLWQKGWYEPGAGGKTSERERTWTYNRQGFPYYCVHCPFLNEILPYESRYGRLLWPVDPPDGPEDSCAWHVFKDPDAIPVSYYRRLGLKKPAATKPRKTIDNSRSFTDDQLREMARPVSDRVLEALEAGDKKTASRLCRSVRDEFLVLHDLYVNMIAATLDFIARRADESTLGDALERQFQLGVRDQLLQPSLNLSLKDKTEFLAGRVFGPDTCNSTGSVPGRFSINETASEIIFRLDPCGSGGRLIRAGSHGPRPFFRKWRESLETNAATLSARYLPIPERLIKGVFPWTVNHFTQRKPYHLGKTRAAHPWSFGRSGTPLYCCQCGKIQEQLTEKNKLIIEPPRDKKQPCLWRLQK